MACPAEKPIEITNNAFFEFAPSHVHYARIQVGSGAPFEYLFTDSQRSHAIAIGAQAVAAPRGATFPGYIKLGIEHILTGLDHVAFLVALLLTARRLQGCVVDGDRVYSRA